jgi:hypothetical protein
MADGIEQAAAAFDADAQSFAPLPKPNGAAPRRTKDDGGEGPQDRLFGAIGDLEVDDDSPAKGGGDDEDPEAKIYDLPDGDDGEAEEGDAGEGDDDDSEGDEGRKGEDQGDDEEFLAQEVQVTVDGEPKTVKLKEALEGYIRTETLHKRLNEIDETKKIVQRVAADAVQNYEYSMGLAKEIEAHLDALVPKEPDWDAEFQKNPARARELQKYYEQVKGFKATLKGRLGEAAKKQAESDAVQLSSFAEAEAKRFDNLNSKHWATDPKKKAKDLQAMRRTALTEKFSEEEIAQVYDSRMLNILLKASKYDRMMAARPKPVQRVRSKPIAPGAGSARTRTAQRGVSTAMKQLNKTGSIEDAAVVFDELIRRG